MLSVKLVDPWKSAMRTTAPTIVGFSQGAPAATEKR
jgi:hypothetical protein